MVEKSSRRGGDESDGGYETEESGNTRASSKWKHAALEKAKANNAKLSSTWNYNQNIKYKDEWTGEQKKWFLKARRIAMNEMKLEDPKRWKKPQKKIFQQQLEKLDS